MPSGVTPTLRGLNFDADSAFIVDASIKKDTITYWLRDTSLVNTDSLEIEYSYYATDTLGQLVAKTDTMLMVPKVSYEKRMKMHAKELEKWMKKQEKMLEGHQPTYPVYFDMEENSVLNLGSSTIGKLANTFCSKISGAGYKVGIYASLSECFGIDAS